jgi:WD repeat-containing protein 19
VSFVTQAKEAAKEYLEAARAYERARDMDSVVRILLENLNKPDKAMEVVRMTKSSEAALMVARHCLKGNDFRGAIEFFLTAKRAEEAFNVGLLQCCCFFPPGSVEEAHSVVQLPDQVAREHDEMELYAEALGEDATNEDNQKIASFYEARGKTGQACRDVYVLFDFSLYRTHPSGWQVLFQVWRLPQVPQLVFAVRG